MINKIQLKNNMSNNRILEDADFKTIIDGTLDNPDSVVVDITLNEDKSGVKVKNDNGDFYNVPIKRSTANSLDHKKVLGSFEQSNQEEDSDYDTYNFMDYDGDSTNSSFRVPRVQDDTDKIDPSSVISSIQKIDEKEKTTYNLMSYSGTKIQSIEAPKSGFFSSLDLNKILSSFKVGSTDDSNYKSLILQDYKGNDKDTIKILNKNGSGAILQKIFTVDAPRINSGGTNALFSQNFSFSYGSDYHSTPGYLFPNGDFSGSKLPVAGKSDGTNAILKYMQVDFPIGFSSISNDRYIKDYFKITDMIYDKTSNLKYSISTSIRLNNQNLNNESMKDFDLQLIKNSRTDTSQNKYNTIPLGTTTFSFILPFTSSNSIFISQDGKLNEGSTFYGHALYNSESDSDNMFVYAIDLKISFKDSKSGGKAVINVKKLSDIDAPDLKIDENLIFHMVRSSIKK